MSKMLGLRMAVAAPVGALYRYAGAARATIEADVARWAELNELPEAPTEQLVVTLLAGTVEFRNLFYYRIERGRPSLGLVVKLARRYLRPLSSLDLSCDDIGPGLVITHGFSTILTAASIGRNCWVHHEVTLGWNHGDGNGRPTIGDDVFIGAGAKIFGPIHVGDGARIGANAVVVKDVPPGATAVGVPAVNRPAKQRPVTQ